ncbi:hypothetical protein [Polaromonas sp.]|uniref:hypothetical protein n=1 Tax=Polaromonas sp. TaxID=1869339 RepID=UPI00342FB099
MGVPLLVVLLLLDAAGDAAADGVAAGLAAAPALVPAFEAVLPASVDSAACASVGLEAGAPLLPPRKSVTYQPEPLS